jgi:hypothetical protein
MGFRWGPVVSLGRDRVVPFRRKAAKLRGSGSVLAWISIASCGLGRERNDCGCVSVRRRT